MPIEPALRTSAGRMPKRRSHGASEGQDGRSERPASWHGLAPSRWVISHREVWYAPAHAAGLAAGRTIHSPETHGQPMPMKDPTVRGVVHMIEETKTFGQKGFRKRLVVLEQSKGTFTNYVPVEFVKDGCDAVDELGVGDEIEVTYRLSGRRWQRDEASEVKYFLSAEGLSFRRLSGSGRDDVGPSDAGDPNDAFAEAADDDVPF
jgi:hypothetical protein